MADVLPSLDEELARWLERQPLFFVATAPLAADGTVNVSPKGMDSLRVLGPRRVAYRDLTGSGVETIAHLRENGRITLMWCAFDRPPRIVRVQGQGVVHVPGDAGYKALDRRLPDHPGARAIIDVDATRIASSCGFSVPLMEFVGERGTLRGWAERTGDEELRDYRRARNATSIDGLPAYPLTSVP